MKGLGLWPQMGPKICHFQQVRLSDGDHPEVVKFSPQDLGDESVFYGAEHGVLMEALQGAVQAAANIHYLSESTLTVTERHGERVIGTLTTPREPARWMRPRCRCRWQTVAPAAAGHIRCLWLAVLAILHYHGFRTRGRSSTHRLRTVLAQWPLRHLAPARWPLPGGVDIAPRGGQGHPQPARSGIYGGTRTPLRLPNGQAEAPHPARPVPGAVDAV
jgi:hypothetical protein